MQQEISSFEKVTSFASALIFRLFALLYSQRFLFLGALLILVICGVLLAFSPLSVMLHPSSTHLLVHVGCGENCIIKRF